MTRLARVVRRPVALWLAAALVLGSIIGLYAFGRGAPAVAFQQAGHWVYNSPLGAVFRVDGGGKNVDAEVPGVRAEPGSPVLQGSSNGYVVGRGKVTVFGKSDLAVKSTIRIGIPEEPLGLEAPGGPYLVYREHGQIVRLGDSRQTVTVGSVVSSAIATPDGTLWVRGGGHFCRLTPGSSKLACPLRAPADDAGALLNVGGKPAFANLTQRTVTRLTGDTAGRPVRFDPGGSLPATSVVAQSDVGGRIPILASDRLLLVDASGTQPSKNVSLPPRRYDALAATGAAIAVLDKDRRELRTFDADGKAVQTHRFAERDGGREGGGRDGGLRVTPGEDGRIYIDDDTGEVVTVVDGDGTVSEVRTDGDNRPKSPAAKRVPKATPTPSSTPSSTPTARPTGKGKPRPTRTAEPEPSRPPITKPRPKPTSKPRPPRATAPGAPGSVSATPDGWKATVKWAAARPNGAPVTSYLVKFRVAPGTSVSGMPASGSRKVVGTDRDTTFTLFKGGTFFCSPRCSYIFSVAATNLAGTGPTVNTDQVTVGGSVLGKPPSAPTKVAAAAKPDGTVEVTWAAPDSPDFNVSGYTVLGSDGSKTEVQAFQPSATLRPALGKAVSYRVTAKNGAGTSPRSEATDTVYPYDQATAPKVTATSGTGSVSLTWTTPNLKGGELVHYLVTASGQPDRKVTTTSTRYTGLSGPAVMSFSVTAITRERDNPDSPTATGLTGSATAAPSGPGTGPPGGGDTPPDDSVPGSTAPPAAMPKTLPAMGVRRARVNRKDAPW